MFAIYDENAVSSKPTIKDAIQIFIASQIVEAKENAKFLILDDKLTFVGMMFWARKNGEFVNSHGNVKFFGPNGEVDWAACI